MHPIHLEFQAFGPYKGHESISFHDLAQNGLFLICGETGSGKTMILDAITFALYGQSSGGTRDDLVQLRCNRCNPADPTFVKFVFEEKGNVYSFERRLEMKRVNLAAKQSVLKLNEQGIWEPVFENCRAKEMTAKATEIIGLNYEQFRQVIILPQGKFEKLLTSTSDEKEKILVNIFGAEKWQKIAEKYYENAKDKKDALVDIKKAQESSLAEEGCKNLEELHELVEDKHMRRDALEKEHKDADYPKQEKDLEEQRTLANEFSLLHQSEKTLAQLTARETEIKKDESSLDDALRAEVLRVPIDKLREVRKEQGTRKEALDDLLRESKLAEEKYVEASDSFAKHEALLPERQEWEHEKMVLDTKIPVYANIDDQKKAVATSQKNVEAKKKAVDEAKGDLNDAIEKTKHSYEAFTKAQVETRNLRSSYMAGITGYIAKDLEEGVPCPVCGSIEHPHKAAITEGSASRNDVDDAEANEDRCKEAWEKADKKRIESDSIWKSLDEELKQVQSDLSTKSAEYDAAKKNLIEGINSLKDLKKKIKELDDSIKEYDDGKESLTKARDLAKQKRDSFETKIEAAKRELENANKAVRNAENNLQKALAGSGFESMDDAVKVMLSDKSRKELSEKIDQYKGSVKTIKGQLSEKQAVLKDKIEPDIEIVKSELERIAAAQSEYDRSHATLESEYNRLLEKYNRLLKDNERYKLEIQDAEDDFTFAKNLRGDTGIGLQRYVLGIMFSSVIKAANEMLKKVHGGRYQLFRTDEKVDGSNKRGLDLKVYDSYAGGSDGRSVSTLSGGEKFLASLALSIGMSTIAKTGGVNIDGIFIDEGFGSLDSESIDDALEVLGSIQKAHGMVGIISHVDVRRANMPTKIQVIKTRETSTIQ